MNPPAEPTVLKVLIVDDHPVVREGLVMHLATQPDLQVCGEAADLPGALALLATTQCDVAIVDISLENSNGLDLIRRIKDAYPEVRILVWSMYPENLYAERALRAGARGYLNKGKATHQVLSAIRVILQGNVYVSGGVAEQLLKRLIGLKTATASPLDCLSDRELEAFQLFGDGLSTELIAAKMHVSPKTIETFRARIKEKLGLKSMNELIQRATQWVVESKYQRD